MQLFYGVQYFSYIRYTPLFRYNYLLFSLRYLYIICKIFNKKMHLQRNKSPEVHHICIYIYLSTSSYTVKNSTALFKLSLIARISSVRACVSVQAAATCSHEALTSWALAPSSSEIAPKLLVAFVSSALI